MNETCKPCDGRGKRFKPGVVDGTMVWYTCTVCNGTGNVQPPHKKAGKPYYGIIKDEEELSLEQQTRAFLRSKGF